MECSCRQLQQLMGNCKQPQLLELSGAGHLTSTPGILCTPGQCHLPENLPDTAKWLNSSLAMVELPASQLQQLQKHLKHPYHHQVCIKTCENFEKVKTWLLTLVWTTLQRCENYCDLFVMIKRHSYLFLDWEQNSTIERTKRWKWYVSRIIKWYYLWQHWHKDQKVEKLFALWHREPVTVIAAPMEIVFWVFIDMHIWKWNMNYFVRKMCKKYLLLKLFTVETVSW